jgi:hypothetical protein
MRQVSSRNNRLYLSDFVCSGGVALKQSYLLFSLFTAMLLSLGVIWLKSVLVMGSPVIEFLAASGLSTVLVVGLVWFRGAGNGAFFDSRSGLMDKFNLFNSRSRP